MHFGKRPAALVLLLGLTSCAPAAEPTAAERGEKALLGRSFTPPAITPRGSRTVGRSWGGGFGGPPADFDRRFRERYGLHVAPYPNKDYPMGFREAPTLFGGKALS